MNTTGSSNDAGVSVNSRSVMYLGREVWREPSLQGSSPGGDPLLNEAGTGTDAWVQPEELKACMGFMNDTLRYVERLKRPVDLPDLKARAESGAPGDRGGEKNSFFHGSAEECRLQGLLQSAKKGGSTDAIEKARGELHQYWRRIIESENEHIPRSDLAQKCETMKDACDGTSNPFMQYRLHVMARRAGELHDESIMRDIEKLRQRAGLVSSMRGRELARYAEASATGEGGHCYNYVANALDRLGINLSGESAYMAAGQLARHERLREIKLSTPDELKNLAAGAIVVWDRNEDHDHGHISIALGTGLEASDVIRSQITDYGSGFRVFIPLD